MTLEQIDDRLAELRARRAGNMGTETEVYARIVGYYRSVRNWNKGKTEEFGQRINYSLTSTADRGSYTKPRVVLSLVKSGGTGAGPATGYLYFYRRTCPNCPPVAAWLEQCGLNGRAVDVDRESGFHEASRYDIATAPTVVFLNDGGEETGRGSTIAALEALAGAAAVAGA